MRVLLLGLVFFLLFTPTVFAQEEIEINTPTVTVTPTPEIQYTLPYPGILPDNPLYFMKATRDRIISFFISDQKKKAEFDLLQADKRVQAGLFLLHKDNPDVELAISTISKGQNYFEQALVAEQKLYEEKKDKALIGDLPDKLKNAALKHNDVLKREVSHLSSEEREKFLVLLGRSEGFIKETNKRRD